MKEFRPAKKRITVSVGESVRIVRELQGLSQNQLAERTGIPQATLSAIENDRVRLGVERAKVLARALKCHPAVLVFPDGIIYRLRRNPLLQQLGFSCASFDAPGRKPFSMITRNGSVAAMKARLMGRVKNTEGSPRESSIARSWWLDAFERSNPLAFCR